MISGVFIFVSMGTQWAKVEYKPDNDLEKFSCSGDVKSYVMPYFGLCTKVTINDKNADDKCTEWKDGNAWKVRFAIFRPYVTAASAIHDR